MDIRCFWVICCKITAVIFGDKKALAAGEGATTVLFFCKKYDIFGDKKTPAAGQGATTVLGLGPECR